MSIQTNDSLPSRLSQRNVALVELDIYRCTEIFKEIADTPKIALFLDGFYGLCSTAVINHGGEVIKYLGDAVLAAFDEDECVAAIDCILAVRETFTVYCKEHGVKPTDIKGTVHTGEVIIGAFGPEGNKDVLGKTANELFTIIGPGLTITEQVYRKLPSDRRGPWKKHSGRVTYVLK